MWETFFSLCLADVCLPCRAVGDVLGKVTHCLAGVTDRYMIRVMTGRDFLVLLLIVGMQ